MTIAAAVNTGDVRGPGRLPKTPTDAITATVTVTEKRADKHILLLDCRCDNQNGETVITGEAQVKAPTEKIRRPRIALPDIRLSDHDGYHRLIEGVRGNVEKQCAEFPVYG